MRATGALAACKLKFSNAGDVLAVLTPVHPLVLAGLVGPDLVISSSSPEANVSVIEDAGTIRVIGNVQNYYGTDGNLDQLQTDIYTSGNYESDFTPASLRDLKIKLAGVDSAVQVGDELGDHVLVGRDLIISMPASTTAAQLADDSIAMETHLNIVVEEERIGRNLTITTGTFTSSEAAVMDFSKIGVGSPSVKGNLSITVYGNVPNMIGFAGDNDLYGNASVSTLGGGDNFIAVAETGVAGRLTISAGGGDNTILCTDDFAETTDSSLQTFVTNNPVFGDGFDGKLTDPCVQTLANDLNAASKYFANDFSFGAQNADIYVLGGDNIIDVADALTGVATW